MILTNIVVCSGSSYIMVQNQEGVKKSVEISTLEGGRSIPFHTSLALLNVYEQWPSAIFHISFCQKIVNMETWNKNITTLEQVVANTPATTVTITTATTTTTSTKTTTTSK